MREEEILAEIIPFVILEPIVLPERLSRKEAEKDDEEDAKLDNILQNFLVGQDKAKEKLKVRDSYYQLADLFSLFHLTFSRKAVSDPRQEGIIRGVIFLTRDIRGNGSQPPGAVPVAERDRNKLVPVRPVSGVVLVPVLFLDTSLFAERVADHVKGDQRIKIAVDVIDPVVQAGQLCPGDDAVPVAVGFSAFRA